MTTSLDESIRSVGNLVKVRPIKHDNRGKRQDFEYSHGEVFPEELEESPLSKVEIKQTDRGMWWKYEGKIPVLVQRDGVYVPSGSDSDEATEQAYRVLSVLDKNGLVERFHKL